MNKRRPQGTVREGMPAAAQQHTGPLRADNPPTKTGRPALGRGSVSFNNDANSLNLSSLFRVSMRPGASSSASSAASAAAARPGGAQQVDLVAQQLGRGCQQLDVDAVARMLRAGATH